MENSFRSFISSPSTKSATRPGALPQLLPDECVSSQCENCKCQWNLDEPFYATLVCTNFRLCLVSSLPHLPQSVPQRFLAFDERCDIPLCSVFRLKYAVFPNGKLRKKETKPSEKDLKLYKELNSALSSLEIISSLKLYLKDMRVLCIDLSKSQHAASLANHILHFAKPARPEHLLQSRALRCETALEGTAPPPTVAFTDSESWRREQRRCLQQSQLMLWRILKMSKLQEKRMNSTYPRHVVVCNGLSDKDLEESVHVFREGRFPIWCYSFSGVHLLRSSLPTSPDAPLLNRISDRLALTHPAVPQDVPKIIRVDIDPLQLADAFEKLHKICAVDNVARARRYSRSWFSRVSGTGWLALVQETLASTSNAVQTMADQGVSVWLQEGDGRDGAAVVSSLVQVCLDKHARRLTGFDALIAKEWSALGHPFGSRVLGVGGAPFSPFFLLFLDCLHQLILLYPVQFEYSSACLIALWDLCLSGLCPTLATDCPEDQVAMASTAGPLPLGRFFRHEYVALSHSVPFHAAVALRGNSPGSQPMHCDIIRPPTSIANLQLWDECFLRWQADVVIEGGGRLMTDYHLDRRMEEMARRGRIHYSLLLSHIDPEQITSTYPYSASSQVDLRIDRPSLGSVSSLRITDSAETTPPSTPLAGRPPTINRSYV